MLGLFLLTSVELRIHRQMFVLFWGLFCRACVGGLVQSNCAALWLNCYSNVLKGLVKESSLLNPSKGSDFA